MDEMVIKMYLRLIGVSVLLIPEVAKKAPGNQVCMRILPRSQSMQFGTLIFFFLIYAFEK